MPGSTTPPPSGRRDHAACGVGFVAAAGGEASYRPLDLALGALARMEHRGGVGADGVSSDGAGVLTAIPWTLLEPWLRPADGSGSPTGDRPDDGRPGAGQAGAHVAAPPHRPTSIAVGMLFLPVHKGKRRLGRDLVTKALADEGLDVLGWRDVPVDPAVLGPLAGAHRPHIEQVVARSTTLRGEDLERALLLARRRIGAALQAQRVVRRLDDLYLCSLSCRTIVYKGMLGGAALPEFYADLREPSFRTPFAVFHRRFSTNTAPKWSLAQPMRLLAHNGEINTLSGNLAWMAAREPDLTHPVWGARIADLLPVLHGQSSDSGALDKFIELLVRSGRSPLEAMVMTMPPARSARDSAAVRDFLDYHAGVLEAWDGPALVAFCDGDVVGAAVDRNGLRPARTAVTESGYVAVASEAGAVAFGDDRIVSRGRLGPGEVLAVDLAAGRRTTGGIRPTAGRRTTGDGSLSEHGLLAAGSVLFDRDVKERVAARHPYGAWLRRERLHPTKPTGPSQPSRPEQPAPPTGPSRPRTDDGHAWASASLLQLQSAAGFTAEDIDLVIRPMARTGQEPRFSMGDDAPLPILSGQLHTLYDYFTQRFAQVTNPPIDPLRERLVMSLEVRLGARGNLLDAAPEHARQVVLCSPLLDDDEMAGLQDCGLPATTLDTRFDVAGGPWELREAVLRIAGEAVAAVTTGTRILVLSDRVGPLDATHAAVPPLLAVAAVHHHLMRAGVRCHASLVVETAQCWTSHHFACLLGYGASAVAPHLALTTVRQLAMEGRLHGGDGAAHAVATYRASVEYGLRKVLSKMGVSLLASYHGAQLFEAVGVGPDLIELGFPDTPSRIGGLSVEELAEESIWLHQRAFPELTEEKLRNYGFIRFRRGGEFHLNNPEAAKLLRRAAVEGSYELFSQYIARMSARPPTVLRDLLDVRSDRHPIDVEETESEGTVMRRFVTGGMSLGALSREAHETLAVAMHRIGGKADSGEGGEDPARFAPLDDVDEDGRSARLPHLRGLRSGDSARTAIKQIASGRFGVTPEYLVNADELEIKVAQGAKPGEGGELPGPKVTAYIAALRRAAPGRTLISPPPHHDIYSIEDLAQLIHDLRAVNPAAGITVKLVAGWGIGTIACGVAKAGADVIHVSGSSGGTAAASLNSIKHAGIPWELGLPETHQALAAAGLRTRVRLRVDGGLRTGRDVLLATLLGADETAFGTSALIAAGCVMARACHLDRCPAGIATQQDELRRRFAGEPQHVANYFALIARRVRVLLAGLGYRSLAELIGRTDLLRPAAESLPAKTADLDWSWLLDATPGPDGLPAAAPGSQGQPAAEPDRPVAESLDDRLLRDPGVAAAITGHGHAVRRARIGNADRAVGAGLAGEIARRHGDHDFRGHLRLELSGAAGQSFGAFLVDGMTVTLDGEANDYVGKGMAGGTLVLRPAGGTPAPGTVADAFARLAGGAVAHTGALASDAPDVIAGNTCLYGATGGRLFAAGAAGERLAVRNSAAVAVVQGAGDHCCEYMTGGTVVVLGPVGRNACAGMTGGTAWFLEPGPLEHWLNEEGLAAAGPADTRSAGRDDPQLDDPQLDDPQLDDPRRNDSRLDDPGIDGSRIDDLHTLLEAHAEHTGSAIAHTLLADWPASAARFVRVAPHT
jgi:glutamate synthase (ferredoxin)